MKLTFLLLFFSTQAFAQTMIGQERCFHTHIKEAIEINEVRKERYRDLYGNGPAKVMNRLIRFEKLILISARWYDLRAKKYLREGIPVICHDLVPMELTPEFSAQRVEPVKKLKDFNFEKLKKELRKNLERGNPNLKKADELLSNALHELEEEPRTWCLTRHFLESMLRGVRLIPRYQKHFEILGGEEKTGITIQPSRLSLGFLRTHIIGFGEMERIDRDAFEWQRHGIPLLCQDVPPIPTSDFLDYPF